MPGLPVASRASAFASNLTPSEIANRRFIREHRQVQGSARQDASRSVPQLAAGRLVPGRWARCSGLGRSSTWRPVTPSQW